MGGQCSALYPEKPIYDIPAHPKIAANELIDLLMEQARPFAPRFHLNQQVIKLQKTANGFDIETSKGLHLSAKAVVIAAGCGAFGPNRPPLANLESYEGKSVFYAVTKASEFVGKNVVIAGGGDSAVDWALSLAEIAASVSLVHRRDKFRAAPENIDRLKKLVVDGKVRMITPYQLAGLEGEDGVLSAVIVEDLDGRKLLLKADILLPFYGLSMDLGPIADFGLALHNSQIAVNPTNCTTSVAGIYAIGDIAHYDGKLKLILTGFSEAANAMHDAYKIVYPDIALHFEYSTSKKF